MNNKTDLRIFAKELRKNLPLQDISQKLANKIKEDKIFQNARNIMFYYPTKYEINLLELLETNKNFYLPRVNGQNLEVCPYKKNDELRQSSELCIYEPICSNVNSDILDLIIVPALMADTKGYRLGYGCGFYDRFLTNVKCKTISAIPKELLVDKLPTDDFDIAVDKIITA